MPFTDIVHSMENKESGNSVVLIDGCRIPFLRSGTNYNDLMAYDLARLVLKALLSRNNLKPDQVQRIIMGTVIQEIRTSNVAREAALGAGFAESVPAHTVTMACISSNMAITSGIEQIVNRQADVVIAGGTETMSDIPIRLKKIVRKKLLEASKKHTPAEYLALLKGLKPSDILPEIPDITEFSTGETMGESTDELAAEFGISRKEQDAFALRSHLLADKATREGLFESDVVPALFPPDFQPVTRDNGIRADSTPEKLAALKPAFTKPHGTLTAGNSTFLSDGASATLIMSEKYAKSHDFRPKARFRSYTYVAQNPGSELLMGPAYAIPRVLDEMGLKIKDIDVFELHEAFAGQVLSNLKALGSTKFATEHLNRSKAVGAIPIDKLNCLGGSLAIGHPFGATGSRLVTTAANRLSREDGNLALVASCAAGGQGHAIILERFE